MVLWCVFNSVVLVYSICQINIESSKINLILWICAHEFLTAILGQQFNPIMTSIIILSYVLIEKEKDFWSACLIILKAEKQSVALWKLVSLNSSLDFIKFIYASEFIGWSSITNMLFILFFIINRNN